MSPPSRAGSAGCLSRIAIVFVTLAVACPVAIAPAAGGTAPGERVEVGPGVYQVPAADALAVLDNAGGSWPTWHRVSCRPSPLGKGSPS